MKGGAEDPVLSTAKSVETQVFWSVCCRRKSAAEMGHDTLLEPHLTWMSIWASQATLVT